MIGALCVTITLGAELQKDLIEERAQGSESSYTLQINIPRQENERNPFLRLFSLCFLNSILFILKPIGG